MPAHRKKALVLKSLHAQKSFKLRSNSSPKSVAYNRKTIAAMDRGVAYVVGPASVRIRTQDCGIPWSKLESKSLDSHRAINSDRVRTFLASVHCSIWRQKSWGSKLLASKQQPQTQPQRSPAVCHLTVRRFCFLLQQNYCRCCCLTLYTWRRRGRFELIAVWTEFCRSRYSDASESAILLALLLIVCNL